MKKLQKNILMLAALLMAGVAVISCDNVDNVVMDQLPNNTRSYTMIVNATMGGSAQTRALELDGTNPIKATWTAGDVVEVYGLVGENRQKLGTLTAQSSGKSTLLVGSLDAGKVPAVDDVVDLVYPSGETSGTLDYTDQDGTFNDIATNHDFAMVSVIVKGKNDDTRTITTESATFRNIQSIIKFKLSVNDQQVASLGAKSFNVCFNNGNFDQIVQSFTPLTYDATTGDITIDFASGTNEIWVALTTQNLLSGELTTDDINVDLIASTSTNVYSYTKSGFSFSTSKFYDFSVPMKKLTAIETPSVINDGAITAAVVAIATYYEKISLEQAWKLANAQKEINGSDVLVLYNVKGSALTAYYASSADSKAKENSVTGLQGLMSIINNAGYYVHK